MAEDKQNADNNPAQEAAPDRQETGREEASAQTGGTGQAGASDKQGNDRESFNLKAPAHGPLLAFGEPLPEAGLTVIHSLKQLSETSGPVWIPCLTMLLQEIEQAERLGDPNSEQSADGGSTFPKF